MSVNKVSRFHRKLVEFMVHDIFHSVNIHCGGDMKETQKCLAELFFLSSNEPVMEVMSKVNHPDALERMCAKHNIQPQRFIDVRVAVNNIKYRSNL